MFLVGYCAPEKSNRLSYASSVDPASQTNGWDMVPRGQSSRGPWEMTYPLVRPSGWRTKVCEICQSVRIEILTKGGGPNFICVGRTSAGHLRGVPGAHWERARGALGAPRGRVS